MPNKITHIFSKQITDLHKKLETILENSELNQKTSKPRQINHAFEAERDLTQVDTIGFGLPNDTEQRTLMMFNRLAVYFDSGILFEIKRKKSETIWQAIHAFDRGSAFPIKNTDDNQYRFPDLTLVEVRTVLSKPLLQYLNQLELFFNNRSRAFIFKPHPDYIFLVNSSMADPWLKIHLEKIHKQVLLLLVDQF